MKEKIVAVIPAFNEEKTIGLVVNQLKEYVDEIIVIDDASTDKTKDEAKKSTKYVFRHDKNLGYDKTIDDGFIEANKIKATIILTFDADGQHKPEDIPKILQPIKTGKADIVVGIRPYKQRVTELVFSKYSKKKIGITDPLCGVKAYAAEGYNKIGYFDKIKSIGTELMFNFHKQGYILKEVNIGLNKRKDKSRFGNSIKSNFQIFSALLKIYFKFK